MTIWANVMKFKFFVIRIIGRNLLKLPIICNRKKCLVRTLNNVLKHNMDDTDDEDIDEFLQDDLIFSKTLFNFYC